MAAKMCVGKPAKILSVRGMLALCEAADGAAEISIALTPTVKPGDHVLVHLGSAMRVLGAEEAKQISDALQAVLKASDGQAFDHLLADLIDREPELPSHLRQSASKEEKDHGASDY